MTDRLNMRVLVVDDEDIVLSLVRDALEDDGFEVVTAASGEQALEQMASSDVHLLITDIRMPRMNGIELASRARDLKPNIAVVFMTGYANLNSAKDAIKQGASDYILKPFELTEMRQAVSKAVEKIRKDAVEKQSSAQLDRLSDLNQMLFTVGDKNSLVAVFLKFALMHCESTSGAIVRWDSDRSNYRMIVVHEDQTFEQELPDEEMTECLDNIDLGELREPMVVPSVDHHPIYKAAADPSLSRTLTATWPEPPQPMAILPISRQYAIYGIMAIGATGNSLATQEASLKFLSITASQLAMSLENLELLDETQRAYARLKELQDETIELEKMAARGEMSAEIGHELNNFLGVVAGNLSLMETHLGKGNFDQLNRYVAAMIDNMEKMRKFTTGLMDLNAISSKQETIYFEKLITEVVDYLKPQKRFTGVTIIMHPIIDQIPFEADVMHIQQLLYNLFNNAADATKNRREREITVSVAINTGSDSFRVSISDSGEGIEPELLEKAFSEKFTTKEDGHGFGLLVCKRVIDGHHGTLNIESAPERGTTIHIDFPLATDTVKTVSIA